MQKIAFDLEAWKTEQANWRAEQAIREKHLNRTTAAIIVSAISIVVGAFAAGAAWWNYFHH